MILQILTVFLLGIILFGYGFIVAIYLLKERNVLAVIGITAVAGPATYLVTANAFGYVLPIQTAFWVGIGILVLVTGIILLWTQRAQQQSVRPPRYVMWIFAAVIVIGGFAHMRILPSDILVWPQLPVVATIAEGNFPVHKPNNPWDRARYHYGPEFLVAATHTVTGVSFVAGYAPQTLLAIAGILFCAGALVYELTRSWRTALIAGLLSVFGSGFAFLQITNLLRDLWQHFMLHDSLPGPFRSFFSMTWSSVTNPPSVIMQHRSSALGFLFLYGFLLALYHALASDKKRWWIGLSVIFAAALALTAETMFVAVMGALPLFVLMTRPTRSTILTSLAIFLPAAFIACVQGGVLTKLGPGPSAGDILVGLRPFIRPAADRWIDFWDWTFIRDFGLPFLLLPFLCIYAWKRRMTKPFILFIVLTGLLAFVYPFVIVYEPLPQANIRFFWITTSLFSLLIGIMLCDTLMKNAKKWKRLLGYSTALSMSITGVLFILLILFFPGYRFARMPLFADLPPISDEDRTMYAWAKEHIAQDQFMYMWIPDEEAEFDQARFMTETGRFVVGHMFSSPLSEEHQRLIDTIAKGCDRKSFETLGVRFVAMMTEEEAKWFERCSEKDWVLRFSPSNDPTKLFPRLYEITD